MGSGLLYDPLSSGVVSDCRAFRGTSAGSRPGPRRRGPARSGRGRWRDRRARTAGDRAGTAAAVHRTDRCCPNLLRRTRRVGRHAVVRGGGRCASWWTRRLCAFGSPRREGLRPRQVSRPERRPSAPTRATAGASGAVGDPTPTPTVRPIRQLSVRPWQVPSGNPVESCPACSVTDASALGGERHYAAPAEATMLEAASEVTSPWTPGSCSC